MEKVVYMYVLGITLANSKNSVASKNSSSQNKTNYSQIALSSTNKGKDKVNFGISNGRHWVYWGDNIIRMRHPELKEMAEYFHKSSVEDIKGVCGISSSNGGGSRQKYVFDLLLRAVNEVKNLKNSLKEDQLGGLDRKNAIASILKRMDERASKVEETYSVEN